MLPGLSSPGCFRKRFSTPGDYASGNTRYKTNNAGSSSTHETRHLFVRTRRKTDEKNKETYLVRKDRKAKARSDLNEIIKLTRRVELCWYRCLSCLPPPGGVASNNAANEIIKSKHKRRKNNKQKHQAKEARQPRSKPGRGSLSSQHKNKNEREKSKENRNPTASQWK